MNMKIQGSINSKATALSEHLSADQWINGVMDQWGQTRLIVN